MSEVTYSFTAAYKCFKVNIERRSKFTTTMHSAERTSANDHAADYLNSDLSGIGGFKGGPKGPWPPRFQKSPFAFLV